MFIIILLVLATLAVSQPCNGLFIDTLDRVYECAETVPFDQSSFQLQIDILTAAPYHATDFYVYRDVVAAGTGPPYDLSYDLDATLIADRDTVFASDWEAENFLWNSFLTLEDMHTTYGMKPPFSYVFPMHPIALDLEYNDLSSKLEVKIGSGIDPDFLWLNYYNGSANPFHGEIVSKINGVDAYTYLSSFAENDTYSSYSKDPSTRLNRMVFWDWHYRPFKKPLVGEMITYELEMGESFTVPFYGCFNTGTGCVTVNSAADLIAWLPSRRRQMEIQIEKDPMRLKSELMSGIEDGATDEEKEVFSFKLDSLTFVDRLEVLEVLQRKRELKAQTAANVQSERMERRAHVFTQRASSRLGDLRCFTDDDRPSVGIIQVMTFMPQDPDTPDTFLDVLEDCAVAFQANSITKVVFDLRSNGGGWIALAMHLARMFMKRPRPAGYDMFDAQVVTTVYDTAIRTLSHPWPDSADPTLLQSLADSVLLADGQPDFTFSGGSAPYNSLTTSFGPLLRLHPEIILEPVMRDAMEYRLEPEDILIVTNGFCGSACGMFTKKMMRTQSAKTVFLGGIKDGTPDPSSFDGAAVLGGLPMEGHVYGFSWGAIMPPTIESLWDKSKSDTTQLAEVVSVDPDWQDIEFGPYNTLGFDLVVDPTRIWTHVLKYFDECADWNVQIASCDPGTAIPSGIYGYECNAGSFDNQTCVFKRCEEGWFFTGTACEPIIDAPMWMDLGLEFVFPEPPTPDGTGALRIVVSFLLVLVFALL